MKNIFDFDQKLKNHRQIDYVQKKLFLHFNVIKFVSDLRQVGGFFYVLWFPPPIKLTATSIAEILLKAAINTLTLTTTPPLFTLYSSIIKKEGYNLLFVWVLFNFYSIHNNLLMFACSIRGKVVVTDSFYA